MGHGQIIDMSSSQGRSLEEVDELFEAHIWAWQFKKYKTTGTAGLLTEIENKGALSSDEAADVEKSNHVVGGVKASQ